MATNHPLRIYREANGISAAELAARIGVQRNTIWRWENWQQAVSPDLWARVSKETGIPVETLATAKFRTVEAAE